MVDGELRENELLLKASGLFHRGQVYSIRCGAKSTLLRQRKGITLGAKITLYDAQDLEVAYVERELFRLMPHYNIHLNNGRQLHLRKEFQFFRNDFSVEDEEGDSMQVEGSLFGYDFRLFDRGQLRMACRKKLLSWGDSYEIHIPSPQDAPAMLAVMLAIDNAVHDDDNDQ